MIYNDGSMRGKLTLNGCWLTGLVSRSSILEGTAHTRGHLEWEIFYLRGNKIYLNWDINLVSRKLKELSTRMLRFIVKRNTPTCLGGLPVNVTVKQKPDTQYHNKPIKLWGQ